MTGTSFADVVEAQRIPTVIRLSKNLYALAYRLMKILPARHILRQARARGELDGNMTVVETTSGTFGLALAMQCALDDQPLILVGDPVIGARLHRQLEGLGARVDIVSELAAQGGFQGSRLARVVEIRGRLGDTFCPEQYSNPDNLDSYALAAEVLADQLGQIDCLVGAVGSGGSMCGTTRHLRQAYPDLTAIGVDTHGSVLFGQPDSHRTLRGLGNSLMPRNLDHGQFDEIHWLDAAHAYVATRRLHRRHALFMGPTGGAAYLIGTWWAGLNPDAVTVVVLPDEGYRYHDTVYDDAWLNANGYATPRLAEAPAEVSDPFGTTELWCRFRWGRRTLAEVRHSHALAGARP